jgi:hypothetical protein
MTTTAEPRKAPTRELGAPRGGSLPGWGSYAVEVHRPERAHPRADVAAQRPPDLPADANDTQLSGLYRGTTLPIRRYVWGVDPNGADPAITAGVCAELGLSRSTRRGRRSRPASPPR